MTKIQLRRDTLVNFTSKNPILAEGELAYETDTKKLKIGDGTTVYNSLAYFTTGGGGGGTTDITASLPLVLNEGVLSLQIDGQTLQVNTEGKLAANLDELGNEVNTLAGRVTVVEADVLQKQDTIVANAPLQLTESSSIELQSNKLSYDNTTGILSYASGTQEDAAARIDLSRLHIKTHEPYTLHLRAARARTTSTGNSNFFRLQCYNDGTDTTFRGVRVWNGGGTGRAGGTSTVVKALQLNSIDYVHYEFRYNGTSGISDYRGRNNDETDATTLPINTFTDQAGDYSKFENEFTQLLLNCYYGYAGKFDLSQSYIEQNNVRYILKDVVAEGVSTLQLNIGDGLSVTNGKLTASTEPPVNMVTTNTTQIISGRKILNTSSDKYLLQIQGDSKIKCSLGYDSASGASVIETSNDGGLEIVQPDATKSFKYNNGTNKYDILHTGNLADNLPTATNSSKGIVKPDGTSITVSSDGTISATATGGGDVTASGDNTFTGKNTFSNQIIIPSDFNGVKGICIDGQSNASIYATGDYLNLRNVGQLSGGSGSDLIIGTETQKTQIRGSSVVDKHSKIFLTQGNVTAGDNVTITDTTDGIQISATGGGSSTNIPLAFGMSQYYKGEMNNASWLKSMGQQNTKALYPDFYTWVLEKANAGTDGFKLSTATDITDYDFEINTTDETFRLPLKNGQENLPDYSDNQVSLPMPFPKPYVAPSDGYLVGGLTAGTANTTLSINGRPAGITNKGNGSFSGSVVVNIAVKKGDVITIDDYFRDDLYFIPLQGNGNLYYYCGNTTQNETLINVGEITNALAGKLDIPIRYPVEVSDKSLMPSWYVVYNDGWCEQGGIMTGSGTGGRVTLTYLKPYINTWFYFNSKTLSTYTGTWTGNFESVTNVTPSSITVWGGAGGEYIYWYSSGYVS